MAALGALFVAPTTETAVVVLYALLFLPDAIDTLKADTIAALSYTSNWWLVLSHQSYAAEVGRPALLKHLWSLAIEEQFYLLWPPLLLLALRRLGRRRTLTTMVAVAHTRAGTRTMRRTSSKASDDRAVVT